MILPKAFRDALGINEGDELSMEIKDGLVLKPVKRRADIDYLRAAFARHVNRLMNIEGRFEPKPGELASICLEEEFE
ncbi:AbrB/MazE/SpoVT family DNA-binding domain-containing protein [Candidatus Bathyarchaeota archaeon]|nr:AbrB/MazE/SpoVT family DNA-binding domain-containing protein [Candidatus Bathyarchaeota archaeon]